MGQGQNLLLCALVLVITQTVSQEVEHENDFNYVHGSVRGPERWGMLRPEWKACMNGSMQSPIDLVDGRVQVVSSLGKLKISYNLANATLRNRGHDVTLQWEGEAGFVQINETKYGLRQCHWHSPAEHTVNGRRYALEVHLVHESPQGKIAVIGIMYRIGVADPFLASFTNNMLDMAKSGETKRDVGMVDPMGLNPETQQYYRYIGSLTTPPCTQNVRWTILRKVRTVTTEQVKVLRDAVRDDAKSNARPTQQLNSRRIKLYRPHKRDL